MPIYEYKCNKCGHKFEKMVRMNDPNPSCPAMAMVDEHEHVDEHTQDLQEALEEAKAIACGDGVIESLQRESHPRRVPGTNCGGGTERLVSLGNFQLKGGGWYKDGY